MRETIGLVASPYRYMVAPNLKDFQVASYAYVFQSICIIV